MTGEGGRARQGAKWRTSYLQISVCQRQRHHVEQAVLRLPLLLLMILCQLAQGHARATVLGGHIDGGHLQAPGRQAERLTGV